MIDYQGIPNISLDDFVRRFPLRAKNLMWFLGAGASASAGLPTALDMIWEFKKRLFVSQRHGSSESFVDLSQPAVRHRIDAHIESLESLPPAGAPDEYAALFETAYPSEIDRRTLIDSRMTGAKPSYGHYALAILMKSNFARLIWTTNFDALTADACAKIFGTTATLTSVALDTPHLAEQAMSDRRWPIEVKLHGDFRSRRLKNTSDELRHQDAQLRRLLLTSCAQYGLIVIGYSGRDTSIMDTLEEAMKQKQSFPSGLFWLHQGEAEPLPRVVALLEKGCKAGIEAFLVRIENFDEMLRDLIRNSEEIDEGVLSEFAAERQRWSAAPKPSGRGRWPVVRFNALPIVTAPTACRLVECEIGGNDDVRTAIEEASADVLAVRSHSGVLAFGADAEIRRALASYKITQFDLYTLDYGRAAARGLLRHALIRALIRNCGLKAAPDQHRGLVPSDPNDATWRPLKALVNGLSGEVGSGADLRWYEGIKIHLEYGEGKLWMLFEPRTFFDEINDDNRTFRIDFARERTVKRYNRELNGLVDFWAKHLAQAGKELRTFGLGNGVDAVFQLGSTTAFSRRAV